LAQAQRDLKNIPVPDPEEERRTLQVADGFEINLFAADPLLAKPIQMNWDAQGRLWVATSSTYPQIAPGSEANDKIIMLEDADGDGTAEKTQVFADGLLIPTGLEPGDGGVYVANSTELVHLKDTDGDGKADQRRVVLSGFGTEDTHHILHTLRWGCEGLLYFNQSIYIHSHIETPHGVRRLESGGIWHFRPETMQLEVFAKGFVNTWGHHQDAWGQSFATDGAYGEGINHVFPGATFVTYKYAKRILKGLNPGSPKHCSLEILSGRHLPDSWQGHMVANDFRAHRVCRFQVTENGAGYTSREQPEIVKTTHVAFRPIDVKMGPDGAIYIADWYNPIIQHGEVDFRDERRDHTHGRIWRITAKGRPLVPRPQLVGASTAALLDQLKSPEGWTRHFAKRVLSERPANEVLPELAGWVKTLDPQAEDFERLRLEALWVYQTFDVVEPQLLETLLSSPDHRVRAATARVVYHWHTRLPNALTLLSRLAADDHGRVRREAVCALGQVGTIEAFATALRALDKPVDEYLDYALWQTANDLAPVWLPAVKAGDLSFAENPRHLEFALVSIGSPDVVEPLLQLVFSGKVPADRQASVLTLAASLGQPPQLRRLFDIALDTAKSPPAMSASLLTALGHSASVRQVRPAGDLQPLLPLFTSQDENLRTAATQLAGLWKLEAAREPLTKLVLQADQAMPVRLAAVVSLAQLGGQNSQKTFDTLATAQQPAELRNAALLAWASVNVQAASARTVELLGQSDPTKEDPAPLFQALLQRRNGQQALSSALSGKKLPADVAKVGLRVARSSPGDNTALIQALNQAAGLTGQAKKLTAEAMQALVAAVAQRGDPARGEKLYRRKDLSCQKCHSIAAAGGVVGPDLLSLGASAQVDYLIESLLDPNAKIKENYHSLVVSTDEGRIYTGLRVRETKDELVLRDAEDREVVIPKKSIDEQTPGKSLMPIGLIDTLTEQELLDLVRFLSELGKVGPYAVSKAPLVRRWQTLEYTPAGHQALNRSSFATVASDDPRLTWSNVYSLVSGDLPPAELPRQQPHKTTPPTSFVRFQLQVTQAGTLKLLLNDPAGLMMWVDGKALNPASELSLDLATGLHTVTVGVTLEQRAADLRIQLDDSASSTGQATLIGGK